MIPPTLPPQIPIYRIAEYKGEFTIEKLTTVITKNKGYLKTFMFGFYNKTQEYLPLRTNNKFSRNKAFEIIIFKSLKEAETRLNKIKFQTETKYHNY